MKRLAVTISLILTIVLALSFSFSYASHVAAAKPVPPSVQMLSTNYGFTFAFVLPPLLATVETLTFSVTGPAKLEVTSLNTLFTIPATCEVVLDSTVLVSTIPNPTLASLHPDLTVTNTSVASGSHTLAVKCQTLGSGSQADGTLSAIITTGL